MTAIDSTLRLFNELFSDPRLHIQFLRQPEQFLQQRSMPELCPFIPELLDRPIQQSACRLDTAILCLTEQCNLNCIHCSVNASPGGKTHLDPDELRSCIEQLSSLEVRVVKFTGGEPLTYPGIENVLLQALHAGMFVEVETSGTLLTEKFLTTFDGFQDTMRFAVGFDSLNADTYERFRNTPGAFAMVSQGFSLLKTHGFQVKIMTVLSKLNRHEIPDIIDWTLSTFGLHGFHRLLPVLSSFGRGKKSSSESGLDAIGLHDFLHNEYFPLFRSRGKEQKEPQLNIGLPLALVPFDLPIYPVCGCGTQKIGVTPKGNVGLCHLIEGHEFAMSGRSNESLGQQWMKGKPFETMRGLERHKLKGVCSDCRFFRACTGGCRVHAEAVYGDASYADPTCQSFLEAGLFPEESLMSSISEALKS
ncbi:MAG: radical SAM protein [Ignavibacteriaceae bacterium]|nr:radical SAM protein [Ignavibacteriaceae bacterium]